MNYPYLLHSFAWTAMAARRFFSSRHSAAAALAAALVLGTALMAGSLPVQAQDAAAAPAQETVNINSADAELLAARLKGVGPSRAEEIVRYREAYGPFASVEELTEVRGISKATLDKNRNAITLE